MWTLGQIGVSVMSGAAFANLAPANLRGRYMGVASTMWSVGAVLGPLLGTALLGTAGRTALWVVCTATGFALFAAQRALAPSTAPPNLLPDVRRASHRRGKARPDRPTWVAGLSAEE